jgi:hypothetical protein
MSTVGPTDRDCIDPERGRLLLDYVLKNLGEAESMEFETHILECDTCYEDFTALLRTSNYLAGLVAAGDSGRTPAAAAFLRRKSWLERRIRILLCIALFALGFLVGYLVGSAPHLGQSPRLGSLLDPDIGTEASR